MPFLAILLRLNTPGKFYVASHEWVFKGTP